MIDRTKELFELFATSSISKKEEALIREHKNEEEFEFINEAYAVLRAIDNSVGEEDCKELLETLRTFAQKEETPSSLFWFRTTHNEQRGEHWEAVLWFLERRLDRRLIREEEEKEEVKEPRMMVKKRKEVRVFKPGPMQFTDESLQATFSPSATPTSMQILKQEAVQLSARHSELSTALLATEETLGTIAKLQNLVLGELAWQEERVKYLEGEAGVTRERVEKGNRMIERAVQTKGGAMTVMTALIVFFALLLFLIHYSSS